MLPVTELIDLARAGTTEQDVGSGSPERFSGAQNAPVVVWNVCRHCNMSCPHCYAAAAFRPSREHLDTREGLRLLDDLAHNGVRIVIFSGGEPLLRPDLFDLLVHASGLGLAPQLSTNGVLIDRSIASRLAGAGVQYVGISIDGMAAFNDGYRGMEGSFDRACRGLRLSKGEGMRTGLRMTLTRRNADQVGAMIGLARSLDVDRFYVSHLLYSGRGRRMIADDLDRKRARKALFGLFARAETLLDESAPLRLVTGGNDSDGPLLLRWVGARYGGHAAAAVERMLRRRGGNPAGERILNIDHRGDVHPDQFWRSETLGNVRKQPFSQILRHPLRKRLANRVESLTGRCGACGYRDLCRGSHRERAIASGRGPWGPDPACVLDDGEIVPVRSAAAVSEVG